VNERRRCILATHEAAGQMIGYLYQVRYAMLLLLESENPTFKISIEKFDDIAFEDGFSPVEMIQNKHHGSAGSLTDRSVDLWKTIKVWLDQTKDKPDMLNKDWQNLMSFLIGKIHQKEWSLRYPICKTDMTEWAKKLELEGQGNSYRIDLGKATVVMDKDRPIALQQMGSGSNWVGVHLIAMFALHKFFISHSRPVPGFLFLDQPSQVYFPSMEHKDENKDLKAVGMIYDFISDCISILGGKMQIIIMDHAQLDEASFKDHVIESWWDEDKNLVPIDWIKK